RPAVPAVAAQLLARNPLWTPDQVKGALMQSTDPVVSGTPVGAAGAGELSADAAVAVDAPINPNAALDAYVAQDSSGRTGFDARSWSHAVQQDQGWAAPMSSPAWGSA